MAQVKAYLDTRGRTPEQTSPIKISITHKGQSALLSLGIAVKQSEWDKVRRQVVKHPQRAAYNSYINRVLSDCGAYILNCQMQGVSLGKSAVELRDRLARLINPEKEDEGGAEALYTSYYEEVLGRKQGKTRAAYLHTLGRIRAFDPRADELTFGDITKAWLERFGIWLQEQGNSINTISIHYRNMRSVFNDAIDNEVTAVYPFRRFKIKTMKRPSNARSRLTNYASCGGHRRTKQSSSIWICSSLSSTSSVLTW